MPHARHRCQPTYLVNSLGGLVRDLAQRVAASTLHLDHLFHPIWINETKGLKRKDGTRNRKSRSKSASDPHTKKKFRTDCRKLPRA